MAEYFIKTYGCQMNKSDSERIAGLLEKIGYRPAVKAEAADLVVFVACSVRQSAIDRVYGQAQRLKKLATFRSEAETPPRRGRSQPACRRGRLITILTGCLLEKDKKELSKKFDIIFDIKDLNSLPLLLKKTPKKLKSYHCHSGTGKLKSYFHILPSYQSPFSAYVPIMTGCNNFCSYCVVPYARGPEISRPAEEIIQEVKNLVKKGYKEITLLGQNVNSYQSKFKVKSSKLKVITFAELLRQINDIPGKFWLRFVTSHPKDMSDELIKTVSDCEKVCEYVHLPAQAGDDKILKKMNRRYAAKHYKNLIKRIRRAIPDVSISTDIIVGFPGETKKQFENTVKLFKEVKFDMAYLARYSPRAQTAAFKLKDNVPKEEKARRERILNEILKETTLENNEKYLGKTVEILLEKKLSANHSPLITYYGKTRTFKNIKLALMPNAKRPMPKTGDFMKVKITKAGPWGMEGELIKNKWL